MKLIGVYILLLLCISHLLGQSPNRTHEILFHVLTVDDHLTSQGPNDYVYRDSRGYIWISSITGLNKYDGSTVRQYRPKIGDTTSLLNPNIQSRFFEDSVGNIWFNTTKAIQCYQREKDYFTRFPFDSTFLTQERFPELVHLDSLTGRFWLTSEEGLYSGHVSQPQKFELMDTLSGISGIGVKTFPSSVKGGIVLFIPKESGWDIRAYTPEESGYKPSLLHREKNSSKAYTAYLESPHVLLIGTDSGLVYLDAKEDYLSLIHTFEDKSLSKIVGIHKLDSQKRILITQRGEFFIFDTLAKSITDQWSSGVIQRSTPFPKSIQQSYLDSNRNLWISTLDQGVYFANIDKWKFPGLLTVEPSEDDIPSGVRSLAEDTSGIIWCLSGKGIEIVNPLENTISPYELSPDEFHRRLGHNPIHIFVDKKNRKWIGSRTGLFVLSEQTGEFESLTEQILPKPLVTQIQELKSGRILVSTDQGIGEVEENEQGLHFRIIPEAHDKKGIHTLILETEDQKVWVSKWEENIQLFHQSPSGNLELDTVLSFSPMINGWVEDSKDSLIWIASSQGLFKLNYLANAYKIQADTLFPIETLNGILEDAEGYLWLSSSQGLWRYDKQGTLNRFGHADGIKNLQFLFWSYKETRSGQFFFGGTNGINFFHPRDIKLLEVAAQPTISELWVNDTYFQSAELKTSKSRPLVFRYQQNTLSFFFTAREYSDPGKNKFKFKMSGVDEAFVELTNGNFVRYPNLPPGTYQFQLMATNSDGIWSQQVYSFYFQIPPPWYKTWYFRLALFLLLAGLIISLINYRLHQIRKEARLNQLIAETETAVLRLQMNPHFLFNSLSSIQNSLSINDPKKANQILSKFILLMRKILEHSERPFIVIADEIELLDQYLMIESIRFDDKFDYDFFVDPQLDQEEIMIPTMILQPFVENAIKHGLSGSRKRKGKIEVHFIAQKEGLLCSVSDNGIGRGATQKRKTWKGEHESKATEITERRLRLIKKQKDFPAELKIIDLTDSEGASIGTEVQLKLPLIM